MDTFYTSDTHFNHGPPYMRNSIIDYCNRPFHNIHHMNLVMETNWNETVKPGDLVVHLGDFGLGSYEHMKDILARLNGYKILVKGNHDRKTLTKLIQMGFTKVYKTHYTIKILQDPPLVISHRPALQLKKGYVNLCGHVHNNWLVKDFSINVGVDVHGFRPVSSKDINKMIPELKEGVRI